MADDAQQFLEWHNSLSEAQKAQFDRDIAARSAPASDPSRNRPGQAIEAVVENGRIVYRPVVDTAGNPVDSRQRIDLENSGGRIVDGVMYGPGEKTPTERRKGEEQAAGADRQIAASAAVLREWGLEELIPELDAYIRGGRSWEEFELGFYDQGTTQGRVVDRLFPEWGQRRAAGNPISIGSIVSYRAQAKQLLRSAGLPEGFYDQAEDFTKFIVGDVSLVELGQRVQDGFVAASMASPEVKSKLRDYYGIDDGGIAAYFIDPTRSVPVIRKQVDAAKVGGAGTRVGLDPSRQSAERLVDLGVDEGTAVGLYAQVAAQVPVLRTLQDRFNDPDDPLTPDEFAEALVINDPETLMQVGRLFAQDRSTFSSGGFAATDRTGGQRGLLAR